MKIDFYYVYLNCTYYKIIILFGLLIQTTREPIIFTVESRDSQWIINNVITTMTECTEKC